MAPTSSQIALQIKLDFNVCKSVVHWDGKLLPDVGGISSWCKVDRLPILLTSLVDGSIKLLGVPKLASGTGKAESESVIEHLVEWKSVDHVVGMCYDTTAINTGRLSGACTLLEKSIGRGLLWLSCRHHMMEVLLSDMFNVCFGKSAAPEIIIFKHFRDTWCELNHDIIEHSVLIVVSDQLKSFISLQLREQHPREDYREFLQLAALIVGLDVKVI